MTTVNHECYVSLEVAKLLKEAGFDWEGTAYYQHGVFYPYSVDRERLVVMNQSSAPSYMEQYSAPSLEVAQRWLREVKNIFIEVMRYETIHPLARELFEAVYDKTVDQSFAYGVNALDANNESIYDEDCFLTYEEAQEAGIKKALKIILEKGE